MMVDYVTILLFFVYFWGLGFTITSFFPVPGRFLERQAVIIAAGFSVFPILSIIINFLGLPLDWKLFLFLSLILPAYQLGRQLYRRPWPTITWKVHTSDLLMIGVVLISLVSLYMYASGAFAYPYLEDEDPWGHTVGVKYVSLEKNAYDPVLQNVPEVDSVLSYIDPYPPAYDILLGILHQTSPDLMWTVKWFNVLIISLGFIFFYLLAKELLGDPVKSFMATLIFAMVPSYLTHFIWAHALAVTLFFPTMYALLKVREHWQWAIIAGIGVASIWVSQNMEQPLKLTTMILIAILAGSVITRKFWWKEAVAIISGIALSFLWWGTMIAKYSLGTFLQYYGGQAVAEGDTIVLTAAGSAGSFSVTSTVSSAWSAFTNPGGSASRAYTLGDFLIAKSENMINNPVGVGIILSLLALLGLGYILWRYKSTLVEEKNLWLCVLVLWFVFGFWGVNGMTFPISVARGAFRTWMILAIPIAFMATEGIYVLKQLFSRYKIVSWGLVILCVLGIFWTSGIPKYQLNTMTWPTSGSFNGPQEAFAYGTWFSTIPANTPVFIYSPRDKLVIGFGKNSCLWCPEVIDFREDILAHDGEALYRFLKQHNYEYLILNGPMDFRFFSKKFGENTTKELLFRRYDEIIKSGRFTPVYEQKNSLVVFKIN